MASSGQRAWILDHVSDEAGADTDPEVPDIRLARLEAQLALAQEAIAFPADRVQKLELVARESWFDTSVRSE